MLAGTYSFLKVNLRYYLCIENLLVISIIMKGLINTLILMKCLSTLNSMRKKIIQSVLEVESCKTEICPEI